MFKIEADAYMKCKFMLEEKIQKAYSMLLGKCTKQLKIKLKQSTGWIQASTIFDFLDLVNLINSIIIQVRSSEVPTYFDP